MNWRRGRDNWELLGREVEGPEEKRWVMVVGTGVIFMILRSLEKIDPMQNRSCHVFRTRSSSFINAVIFRFQNLNTQMLSSIANVISA